MMLPVHLYDLHVDSLSTRSILIFMRGEKRRVEKRLQYALEMHKSQADRLNFVGAQLC